jgi:hypothetical protein
MPYFGMLCHTVLSIACRASPASCCSAVLRHAEPLFGKRCCLISPPSTPQGLRLLSGGG